MCANRGSFGRSVFEVQMISSCSAGRSCNSSRRVESPNTQIDWRCPGDEHSRRCNTLVLPQVCHPYELFRTASFGLNFWCLVMSYLCLNACRQGRLNNFWLTKNTSTVSSSYWLVSITQEKTVFWCQQWIKVLLICMAPIQSFYACLNRFQGTAAANQLQPTW